MIEINIDDLRSFSQQLEEGILEHPMASLPGLEGAVAALVQGFTLTGEEPITIDVRVVGHFGKHKVTPRGLSSSFLSAFVCVEGIVTKCSIVRPAVTRSVHYSEALQKFIERDYRDGTTSGTPTPTIYPTQDEQGNPLTTEFGLSHYEDRQMITVQEMPEKSPAGQLPRSVDVLLRNDLVDLTKPGDRVQIYGTFRALGAARAQGTSGLFRTVMIANNVRLLSNYASQVDITEEDQANIHHIAAQEDVFEKMSRSIAPSIYGHELVKKAVLLMLLGGNERILDTGTHLRGDINLLLVGDPSTAKSQMLRSVSRLAPLAVLTTGRGSSGAGLTAAVTTDQETGDRRLEAGAMVLADRGVVCIDEFDKMSEIDRVAIHEVMEQQTVTIAKAGIHASLNARCSVIAAANPVYGQYDISRTVQWNVALPDSLLTRFDLLFLILDQIDPTNDRRVADHVIALNRWRDTLTHVDIETVAERQEDGGTSPVFEENHPSGKDNVFSLAFLKKYIHYCRERHYQADSTGHNKPELTAEAIDLITQEYGELRSAQQQAQPITPRTLETLIRLATAHAKCRLSDVIEPDDCEAAFELVRFTLNPEAIPMRKKRRAEKPLAVRVSSVPGGDADAEEPNENGASGSGQRLSDRRFHSFQRLAVKILTSGNGCMPWLNLLREVNRTAAPAFTEDDAQTILEQWAAMDESEVGFDGDEVAFLG
eukprot:gnl/Trimastix_PCT/3943.p1 GENE.gnl/Trimastix_PCT/3943~~gnl/Trimastix_PCT/3943.p1  ORF type:complete len:708 (+),score=143.66 gnl/Trimastix_PCT/3943:166-2289(+)